MGGTLAMGGAGGPKIESAEQMLGHFVSVLNPKLSGWRSRLSQTPSELGQIELELQAAFAEGAGMIAAGLSAVVMAGQELAEACEQTRRGFGYRLAKGRNRTHAIRLLGGFVMWATTLYCAPARGLFRKRDESLPGVHVELEQFGFSKGVTPGVESKVARQAALCPSLELASRELKRDGLPLSTKAVRRVAMQCGEDLLKLRRLRLDQWRAGKLAQGSSLRGQRVTVQIDGGRTRLRSALREKPVNAVAVDADGLVAENSPGRSRRRAAKTFDAPWREPKLVTIFVHDENGKMQRGSKATIDGTFLGPDALAEVVAMHLWRMGADHAASLTFVADGALWIWDRIDWIVGAAKIDGGVKIHQVLDCCHAVHHVSLALKEYGLSDGQRLPLYRQHRTLIRNGQWRRVVEELQELCDGSAGQTGVMQREIDYLRKHGELGRLSYPSFRSQGIPLGSGAIESSIRRVVNLRLKSNAMFWTEPAAESMLQLRALVISDRWDESISAKQSMRRQTRVADWRWQAAPNGKSEASQANPDSPQKTRIT